MKDARGHGSDPKGAHQAGVESATRSGANRRVQVAHDALHTALGTPEFWNTLRTHVEGMSPADVKDLARRFAGERALSRGSAIKKIGNRQRNVETFQAKARATGGRSAA